MKYDLQAKFHPTGDQPEAISQLTSGVKEESLHKLYWELLDQVKRSPWLM